MSYYKNYKNLTEGYITDNHDVIELILIHIMENYGQNGSSVALELYKTRTTLELIKNNPKYENMMFFVEKDNTFIIYEKMTKYICLGKISSINKIYEYKIIYL